MAYDKTADNKGRQARPLVGNESEDGTGAWHLLKTDSDGKLVVSISPATYLTGTFTTSSTTVPADANLVAACAALTPAITLTSNSLKGWKLLTMVAAAIECVRITSFNATTGVFTPNKALSAAPGLVTYILIPDADPAYDHAPRSGEAFTFYVGGLPAFADSRKYQVNPTLAAGDVKLSKDGGAFANLTTLPVVTPAGGKQILVSLSAAEMAVTKDFTVQFSDAADDEWCDVSISFTVG
jgi:hypothetical protein